MNEKELLELFLEFGLCEREKQHLSFPMNTVHEKMFLAFKRGLELVNK